jgi:hypothetical protein
LEPRTLLAAPAVNLAPTLASSLVGAALVGPAAATNPTGTTPTPSPTTTAILTALTNLVPPPATGLVTGVPALAASQGSPSTTAAATALPSVLNNTQLSLPGGNTSTSQALNNLLNSGATQGAFLVNLSGGVVSPLTLVPQYLLIPSFQTVNRNVGSGGGDNSMLANTQVSAPPPVRMTPLPQPVPPDVNQIGGSTSILQEDGSAVDGDTLLPLSE